jgi:hypothetical protein
MQPKAYYIVQAIEHEIPYEALQAMAQIMAESSEITHADATYRIRSSRGIIRFSDEAEANRVSAQFYDLGLRNFVLQELLAVPKPEHLNLERPELDEEVALAAVGRLRIVTEKKSIDVNPLRMRFTFGRIPVPGSSVEEKTTRETKTRFHLDLFTLSRHWRAQVGSVVRIADFVESLHMPGALLSQGVKRLLKGDRNLPTFKDEREYERYVQWLYQIRYAAP